MDIKFRRERIIAWVGSLEDAQILDALDDIRNTARKSKESVLQLTPIQEEALEAAYQSYLSGDYLTSEQAKVEAQQWLGE